MSEQPLGPDCKKALLHPNNSPSSILRFLWPDGDFKGLNAEGIGVILDPRGGEYAERNPSFSCGRKPDGMAVFHRKDGGDKGFNSITLIAETLGIERSDAVKILIQRAGIQETTYERGRSYGVKSCVSPIASPVAERSDVLQKDLADVLLPLEGWKRIEMGEDSEECVDIRRRGLEPALRCGLLEAYRFQGTSLSSSGRRRRHRLARGLIPGALGFVVHGPEGDPVAIKFRNPGQKEALDAAGVRRYHIPFKGSTAAWCSPGLTLAEVSAELWVEGELNGIAFALALRTMGIVHIGVQGLGGASGKPHTSHNLTERKIYIYADPDPAGKKACLWWADLAVKHRAVPYVLSAFQNGVAEHDAAAFLAERVRDDDDTSLEGTKELYRWLANSMEQAEQHLASPTPLKPTTGRNKIHCVWPYAEREGKTVKLKRDDDGNETVVRELLGFTARITTEVTRDDGGDVPAGAFLIEGKDHLGRALPTLTVALDKFSAMAWPAAWGVSGFIYPGQAVKDEARAALQLLSREEGINRLTIYTHTGWRDISPHGPVFLTAKACIGAEGSVPEIKVELLGRLASYALPDPTEGESLRNAVRASLELIQLAPPIIVVPMLGMAYRAPLGDINFAAWVSGPTGMGKTALAALCQSHFGKGWTAKHLPASWQGTANSLLREAYLAKDVLFVLDDFKPEGSAAQVHTAQAELSKVLGSAGDRAGRSRLSQDGVTVKVGPYPRGAIIATAETTPRKTSDVARTVAIDVAQPLFGERGSEGASERFEAARRAAERGVYAEATSGYICWIARHYPALTGEALRRRVWKTAADFSAPHARTPENAAELAEGWRAFLSFALGVQAISLTEAETIWQTVYPALQNLAVGQAEHLVQTDPVNRSLMLLGSAFRTGQAHVVDAKTGGRPEESPETLGWVRSTQPFDLETGEEHWQVYPRSVMIGYSSVIDGRPFLLLDRLAAYHLLNKLASAEGHSLPMLRTLWSAFRNRFHTSGDMICQRDRATYPRSIYGAIERVDLINIVWPLPEFERDERDSAEKKSGGTASSFVPFKFSSIGTI